MKGSTMAGDIFTDGVARLQKLRTMSPRELRARAGYKLLTAWERSRHRYEYPTQVDDLVGAVDTKYRGSARLEWLLSRRRERRAAFLPSVENRNGMQDLFCNHYIADLQVSREKAELTRSHTFEFFGQRFVYGSEIDWHADPETGRRWPRMYHGDVPIHDTASAFGDVKYVWELNRQQFLLDLGKLCFLESNPDHASAAVRIVRSWIAHNACGVGVNWACALEPAFRVFSWLWTYHLCLDSDALDDKSHLVWLSGFYDHARFLYRHLETYSSPYNHLIGEAAALYALGVLFPEFRGAHAWRHRGRKILESRLSEQFYSDGGSVEQSSFYHHATLGFYLFSALVGRANNEELADPIWRSIERAIEFSMHLTQPDGSMPSIGGADDGKPIRLGHGPLWDFRAFQAVGAVLFDRRDMKYVAGDFPEDALWLLGPSGRTRFEDLDALAPRDSCHALQDSGYFVVRNAWSKEADYLCVDCGEQADGVRRDGVPNAVHGHADCLSATLWLGGRPVLVDPGVYRYNGDALWVSHFRGTGAHSTLTVDGCDQARYHGKMSWSNAFRASVEAWHPGVREAYIMGSHDGYARLVGGLIHRRVAWMRADGYVIFWDEITGEGEHQLELRYQFAPGPAKMLCGHSLLFDDFAETGWAASVSASSDLRMGGPEPRDGWIATSLGVRRPAPVLIVAATFKAPRATFLTVFADRRISAGAPRLAVIRNDNRGMAVAVRNRHAVDWIVTGDMKGKLPFRTDGKLAIWKVTDGHITDVSSIGGQELHPREGEANVDIPDAMMPGMALERCG